MNSPKIHSKPTGNPIVMAMMGILLWGAQADAKTEYSHPQASDQEQMLLELINRARLDPAAEAARLANTTDSSIKSAYNYYKVNLILMRSEIAAIPAAPPLVFNASLMTTAQKHSKDMFTNTFQSHTGSDGSTLATRAQQAAYNYASLSENIYAYSSSADYTHAAFESDWGFDSPADNDGMQAGRGHRVNIHNASFRDIGIGVSEGSKTGINPFTGKSETVGPMLVTQDFGKQSGPAANLPYLTGVAYFDLNKNGSYDVGEGIGGLRIDVDGATHFAKTGTSGGYAMPLAADGEYVATISGTGMDAIQETFTVANLENEKLDFAAEYNPAISGGAAFNLGVTGKYQINGVAGATSYDWIRFFCDTKPVPVNAEAGAAAAVKLSPASPGYAMVQSSVRCSGSSGYRLAHHSTQLGVQVVDFGRTFRPTSTGKVTFWKRAVYLGTGQVAGIQISQDEGSSWETLWYQIGSNGAADSAFTSITVDLSKFAGGKVNLRMVLGYTAGYSYYNGLSYPSVGFYFDDVTFSGIEELVSSGSGSTTTGEFEFTPDREGTFCLAARARIPGRILPYGDVLEIAVGEALPTEPPAITSSATTTGAMGSAFKYTITASNRPTGFGASGLPEGLSLTPSDGVISGTPAISGTFQVTLAASNGVGTGNATLQLAISEVKISAKKGDWNKDSRGDLIVRASSGAMGVWHPTASGGGLLWLPINGGSFSGYTPSGVGDFNGDGNQDVVLQMSAGAIYAWCTDGKGNLLSSLPIQGSFTGWKAVTTGDFNGDGQIDILLSNTSSGALAAWCGDGSGNQVDWLAFNGSFSGWTAAGAGDLNGDGNTDILLWHSASSYLGIWCTDGNGSMSQWIGVGTFSGWVPVTAADVNGDGNQDILLRHTYYGVVGARCLTKSGGYLSWMWMSGGSPFTYWVPVTGQ